VSGRLEPAYFERLYAERDDPWDFATSPYERSKYARTLAACGPGPFGRTLEIGCSIGVFTAMLAPRCRRLLAVDCSERAVARARRRLGGAPGVTVERRTLPEERPRGDFDLVVCSEVLYYWSEPVLLTALGWLRGALRPEGRMVAVHWRPATRTYPLQGGRVHELLLRERGGLRHAVSEVHPRYLLDVLERPG
jgi:SAM-dependent methyltransferase